MPNYTITHTDPEEGIKRYYRGEFENVDVARWEHEDAEYFDYDESNARREIIVVENDFTGVKIVFNVHLPDGVYHTSEFALSPQVCSQSNPLVCHKGHLYVYREREGQTPTHFHPTTA